MSSPVHEEGHSSTSAPTGKRKRQRLKTGGRKHKRGPSKPRSKPHPNDHQFKVSPAEILNPGCRPTINRLRGARSTPTTIVFALAMGWDNGRDRLRLQMLQLSTHGTKIITVSENTHGLGGWPHLPCNFAVDRGHKSIAARVAAEKGATPSARIVVVLDHYWCELGYYEETYGLLWLCGGASRFLKAGADEVLLPFDNGIKIPKSRSGMVKMLGKRVHEGISVEFVAGSSNPLWLASQNVEIEAALGQVPGGDNAEQTRHWLDATRPFVRCTSKCC